MANDCHDDATGQFCSGNGAGKAGGKSSARGGRARYLAAKTRASVRSRVVRAQTSHNIAKDAAKSRSAAERRSEGAFGPQRATYNRLVTRTNYRSDLSHRAGRSFLKRGLARLGRAQRRSSATRRAIAHGVTRARGGYTTIDRKATRRMGGRIRVKAASRSLRRR